MKLCRFQPLEFSGTSLSRASQETRPQTRAGIIDENTIHEFHGELWGRRELTGQSWPLDRVKLLPPSIPTKIVCVGRNYLDHAKELNSEVPKQPLIFLKPSSAVIAPEEPIVIPSISQRVDYEGELAMIIGRRCSQLRDSDDVRPYILGYTCLNDVTARDLQKLDVQFTRAKGFDTFCPFGPVLETEAPGPDALIETYVNGAKKQSSKLELMIFSVDTIVRWIAQVMTLEPGDLIATGTPEGVGPLTDGDEVEVRISGIGSLKNRVAG